MNNKQLTWDDIKTWRNNDVKTLFKRTLEIYEYNPEVRFLFLTLTMPTTLRSYSHSEQIDILFKAQKSFAYTMLEKNPSVVGYVSFMDFVIDTEKSPGEKINGYHFHMVIAVNPTYFTNHYVSQRLYSSYWTKALSMYVSADVYTAIANIKAVKFVIHENCVSKTSFINPVMKIFKYCMKIPLDLNTVSDHEVLRYKFYKGGMSYMSCKGYTKEGISKFRKQLA